MFDSPHSVMPASGEAAAPYLEQLGSPGIGIGFKRQGRDSHGRFAGSGSVASGGTGGLKKARENLEIRLYRKKPLSRRQSEGVFKAMDKIDGLMKRGKKRGGSAREDTNRLLDALEGKGSLKGAVSNFRKNVLGQKEAVGLKALSADDVIATLAGATTDAEILDALEQLAALL